MPARPSMAASVQKVMAVGAASRLRRRRAAPSSRQTRVVVGNLVRPPGQQLARADASKVGVFPAERGQDASCTSVSPDVGRLAGHRAPFEVGACSGRDRR